MPIPRPFRACFSPRVVMPGVVGVLALAFVALNWRVLLRQAYRIFLEPGSLVSVYSLAAAAVVAAAVIVVQRRRRGRRTGLPLLRRALLPRRFVSASTRSDLGFFALNTLVTGALIGWAVLSFPVVEGFVARALVAAFGTGPQPALPQALADLLMTASLFLAYEFGYWVDHYTSHHVRVFWEFHRVHHTAETLTPMTNSRVHPIESLKFANILVLAGAPVSAVGHFLLGGGAAGWTVGGSNVLLLLGMCLIGHLQHSHVWIAFTGRLGRVVASPAHHQIHHSADPAHFGHNLGSMLSVFDWLFGTLLVPTRERQALVFGVDHGDAEAHTITGGLLTPFVRAFDAVRPKRAVRDGAVLGGAD